MAKLIAFEPAKEAIAPLLKMKVIAQRNGWVLQADQIQRVMDAIARDIF
jgi:hypothetical protein